MDERTLLIDSIVSTLAKNTNMNTATEFIKYAKENIEDGSSILRSFNVETIKDLDEEQKDLLCRTVAENFKKFQQPT